MEINQFNIQNPTDSHTWQKINIGGVGGVMFHIVYFRLAEDDCIQNSQPEKPTTNTCTLKYDTLLPDIFNKLKICCIVSCPEQPPETIFCVNIQDLEVSPCTKLHNPVTCYPGCTHHAI